MKINTALIRKRNHNEELNKDKLNKHVYKFLERNNSIDTD